ncbi:D-3-phosphoglycerate dehydrogenase [Streptomyces sp. NL15-2K]|nr:D-3-phosphoglycerate dehydrogenase [Streptomyces sp. NL15-2K]
MVDPGDGPGRALIEPAREAVRSLETDVIDMVRTGAVELGLSASAGPVSDKEVVSHALGRQRFVLVVPADGPFADRTAVECGELAGQRLIVEQRGTGMRAYVDALREPGIEFTVAAETEHRVSLMPLVLAGAGLAVVTDSWRAVARRLGSRVLDQLVTERAASFPQVAWDQEHIDALAAKFVLEPARFDVVVASNLFGDTLSDLAAAVAGSIGIAPAANRTPERDFPSMFEPVHGSAPDIAGQGIANPLGAIWSAAMMLEHLGHPAAARDITDTIASVLAKTDIRTRDLGGAATTAEFTDKLSEWRPRPSDGITGRTVLVWGTGPIGRAIARLLRAVGMRVCGAGRKARTDDPDFGTVHGATTLRSALTEADYVVLAAPLTQDTRGMVDASVLAAMKPGGAADQRRPGRTRRRGGAGRPPRRRTARRRSPGRVRPGTAACRITPVGHARRDDLPTHGGRDHQRAGDARRGVPRQPHPAHRGPAAAQRGGQAARIRGRRDAPRLRAVPPRGRLQDDLRLLIRDRSAAVPVPGQGRESSSSFSKKNSCLRKETSYSWPDCGGSNWDAWNRRHPSCSAASPVG